MYDLFTNEMVTTPPIQTLPEFVYIKGGLQRELLKITSHYRQNVLSVPNQHPLVRFILSLPINMRRDIYSLVERANNLMFDYSSLLQFTNSLNYGRVFTPGFIYGKPSHEIIITHSDPFDIDEAYANWEDLEPLKIIRHPFTDLSMGLLNGKYQSPESGIVVALLNVPMLCLMIKGFWVKHRNLDGTRDIAGMSTMSIPQFVATYPLLNALRSHLDVAIFNRLSATYMVDDVCAFSKKHPFNVNDYTDRVDNYIRKQLQIMEKYPFTFDQLLLSLPAITSTCMRDVVQIPPMAPTRQVKWAIIVARIELVRFLVQYNSLEGISRNRDYLQSIMISLQTARNDRVLDRNLPKEVMMDIDDSIHQDILPYVA